VSGAPIWRVEFDPAAARELRKLGHEARSAVQKYLREQIATVEDPQRSELTRAGSGRYVQSRDEHEPEPTPT
jgi:mRNA-degrading endonuclease RelE of RelBE toxin-antitoxin system